MKSEKPETFPTPTPAKPRAARAKQVPQESAVRSSPPAGRRRLASTLADGEDLPNHQAIAERAYAIYESRNWQHGHDLDDWLRAESELMAGRQQAAASSRRRRQSA
jgi:hypothetical protein